MNIYDISKKAGVSTATISRVLNDSDRVSPETKKHVLDIMKKEGYTPNAFARGLGLDSMKNIGIVCPNSNDIYISDAIYYIEEGLRQSGYDSILCCTGEEYTHKKKCIESMINSKRVDGVILVGSSYVELEDTKNDYIRDLAKKCPIMMLNGYIDGDNIYCCVADDYRAMYDITRTLIKRGRKNLMYLYRNVNYSALEKLKGFEDALISERINNISDFIQMCDGEISEVKNKLNFLHQHDIKFDAILTSDDEIAIGALKYAQENGVNVPDDLCIIGYNNSKYGTCSSPELTSIDSNVKLLAQSIVRDLLAKIDGNEIAAKTIIATKIVARNTTKIL